MRNLAPLCLLLACWSPDGYAVRDAALSFAADAPPLPETGADVASPVDHPAVSEDAPAEGAVAVDTVAPDVGALDVAAATDAPASDVRHVEAPSAVDAGVDAHDASADVGIDAAQAAPETGADVVADAVGDSPTETGSADAARDAGVDIGMDAAGVDTGAEVGADAPWAPDVSVAHLEFCGMFLGEFSLVCRACTAGGGVGLGFCAFCPATGACSPEVRLPDGTRTALAPCPGLLMFHGENRCPIPDGGL